MSAIIKLEELKSNYIDLAKYPSEVTVTGMWIGKDRLVFKNAKDTELILEGATIESSHAEDAIVIEGADVFTIKSFDSTIMGGLTFWKAVKDIVVSNLHILYPHTGIRFTEDLPTTNVLIMENLIVSPTHEGIYWGKSAKSDKRHTGLKIVRNTIKGAGWDGIQVGNADCHLNENTIDGYGQRKTKWQDKGFSINPNCIAYLYGNKIENGTGQKIAVLDSRCFID